jgi:hypothetical protein
MGRGRTSADALLFGAGAGRATEPELAARRALERLESGDYRPACRLLNAKRLPDELRQGLLNEIAEHQAQRFFERTLEGAARMPEISGELASYRKTQAARLALRLEAGLLEAEQLETELALPGPEQLYGPDSGGLTQFYLRRRLRDGDESVLEVLSDAVAEDRSQAPQIRALRGYIVEQALNRESYGLHFVDQPEGSVLDREVVLRLAFGLEQPTTPLIVSDPGGARHLRHRSSDQNAVCGDRIGSDWRPYGQRLNMLGAPLGASDCTLCRDEIGFAGPVPEEIGLGGDLPRQVDPDQLDAVAAGPIEAFEAGYVLSAPRPSLEELSSEIRHVATTYLVRCLYEERGDAAALTRSLCGGEGEAGEHLLSVDEVLAIVDDALGDPQYLFCGGADARWRELQLLRSSARKWLSRTRIR